MKQLFYLILSFLVIVFIAFIFFFKIPKNANAQVLPPQVTCTFDTYTVYPGTVSAVPYPYAASNGYLPHDIPFSIQLTCTQGGTFHVAIARHLLSNPTDPFVIDKTINGTGTGTYGTLSNPFGPYAASSVSGYIYTLLISAEISGQPADMTCQPSSCQFRFGDIPFTLPPPPPPPTPPPPPPGSSACPPSSGTFSGTYRYSPDPPPLNQPFQVQFNVPTNGTNVGMLHFKLTNSVTSTTTDIGVIDAASSYGVWYAPIPAQSNQASWQLFSDVLNAGTTVTCSNGTLFNGIGTTPNPALGNNPCDSSGCETAIGKIPTNLGNFATAVLRIALGISGGIVLILMVIGSIRVMTSSGDPQRVAAGREMIIAAIAGALFIAFSVMIMQFLGTAIVPIPGLTFGV